MDVDGTGFALFHFQLGDEDEVVGEDGIRGVAGGGVATRGWGGEPDSESSFMIAVGGDGDGGGVLPGDGKGA